MVFCCQSRAEWREQSPVNGVRLNTYSDSMGLTGGIRTSASFQRRDPTPRRGPETLGSTPTGYPFKVKAAVPSVRDSSFLWTCQWGGCSKACSLRRDVAWPQRPEGGALPLERRKQEGRWPVLLPSLVWVERTVHSARAAASQEPGCRSHSNRPAAMMISADLLDPRMRIEIEVTALRQSK